jgi:aspartate/methionine/tyrosine aminotransferase
MSAVQTPVIPVVGDWVRSTPGTISLGQGMVWYGPPREALEAATAFGKDPEDHRYQAVEGIPPLIAAIEAKLGSENGIGAARVVVTAGGNMAFLNAVLAIADPGDEFLLQAPYYFNHEMAVEMAGCRAVAVPTDENCQLRPDAIARAITARTRAVVTVSPNNPTGAVYPEADLCEVNAICGSRGIFHIHDEAYEYFTYGGARHFSPGSLPGAGTHTISLFSLSKAYGFAGWRVGYMAIPEFLLDAVRKIQDTNLICPPGVSQAAALGALRAGAAYARERLRSIAEVREVVLAELSTLAPLVTVPRADGAFYFLLKVRSGPAPMALAERLVREHRVAVIPGTAFGMNEGCTLRVAYGALEKATAAEGVGRLVRGLRAILG